MSTSIGDVRRWGELTRDQIGSAAPKSVILLPVGSIEQHGPHLPTMSDTAIVTAVAERACRVTQVPVLLAPAVCYGASDHHLPFGGTLSLTANTFRLVLTDLIRSAVSAGGDRILILNGHGGNVAACALAANDAALAHDIAVAVTSYWDLADPPDGLGAYPGHAGAFETSLMQVISGQLVQVDCARPSPGGDFEATGAMTVHDPAAWRRLDGFTDDPSQASPTRGEPLLEHFGEAVARAIETFAALSPTRH
jgi:creatinine amidohydrolase